MIIGINEKQEIIFTATGLVAKETAVDNATTFEVAEMPVREKGKITCFNPETQEFYYKDRPPIDLEAIKARQAKLAERREAETQKAHCLKWLAANDWKVNKRMLGEWAEDDERWSQYLAERKTVREQYDAAIAVLNQ